MSVTLSLSEARRLAIASQGFSTRPATPSVAHLRKLAGRLHAFQIDSASYRPGETRQCIVLNAIGDAFMSGIALNDVHITYDGGSTAEEALREVPQVAGEYFEIGTPPAFGLFARNVRGLMLHGVRFETVKPDLRPAIVLDHVSDGSLSSVSAPGNNQAKALLRFVEVQDVTVIAPRMLAPAPVFLQVEGAGSHSIRVEGGDLSKAATPVAFAEGAASTAATVRWYRRPPMADDWRLCPVRQRVYTRWT